MNPRPHPCALEGVRVLDLSRVLAGPWASQLLGDLGAEIIKIEKPGDGDDTRSWGPPFVEAASDKSADAAYFMAANRNKKSVAIDIAQQEGAALVRKMAMSCDIFVENFKVGGLKKYGLDYLSVSAVNPRIVYCSITGFGQTGPYAARAGYDYMIQAMGGLMSITGQPDGSPGGEPMKVGVAVADLFSGIYAASAILAALRHAERTGEGQHIDVALFDCQIAMLANQASNFFVAGEAPTRLGNAHPNIAPYQVFPTLDGYIVIAVGNDSQFMAFTGAIGAPSLGADEQFRTNRDRVKNRRALNAILQPMLREQSTEYWLAAMEAASVPAGPINTIDKVFSDPQAIERRMATEMERGDGSRVIVTPHPVKYSRTPAREQIAPPILGGHTDEVLLKFMSQDEISAMRTKGIIG